MSDPEENWGDIPSLNLEMDTDYETRVKGKEGRRHARVNSNALKDIVSTSVNAIPIRIATASQGVFDGVISDLSQSGVRLTSPKSLSKGEKVKVGFKVDNRTIISKAIIRWTCTSEMYITAGLEFRGLSSSDEEFLGALAAASLFNKTGVFRL